MQHNFNEIFMSDNQCLNCGAGLNGKYCHVCGQQAGDQNPTVRGFVFEYVANAFMWDSKFLTTLWLLIRRPGHLTNEFLKGKIVSYVHPLKLNMFMLFVFITLFLMFSGTTKLTNTVEEFTTNENVLPIIQMDALAKNEEYAEKVMQSQRCTVQLVAPLTLATEFPQFITHVETIEDTPDESADKWTAVIPQILIDDQFVVEEADGFMKFNAKTEIPTELKLVDIVWREMVNITTRYYPIIILLTAPFLSISLRMVQRKKKSSHFNNFIFSLHYTAFLELLTIALYISYLIFTPSSTILEWVLTIGSITYLTIAFRNAYNTSSWVKAIAKALFTSIIYFIICLLVFLCIFAGACFMAIDKI